ncbi:putative armadillo-like helical protein [Helianthus debilis subsp. tardiflorus]
MSARDQLSSPKSKPETPAVTERNPSVSEDTQMADETQPLIATEVTVPESVDPAEVTYAERLTKLKGILSGETSIQLTLQFLYSHNKSDLLILKTIKQSIEMRKTVCHSATIYANALMHARTTVDTFWAMVGDKPTWPITTTNGPPAATTMVGDKPPRTVATTIIGARRTRMGTISS